MITTLCTGHQGVPHVTAQICKSFSWEDMDWSLCKRVADCMHCRSNAPPVHLKSAFNVCQIFIDRSIEQILLICVCHWSIDARWKLRPAQVLLRQATVVTMIAGLIHDGWIRDIVRPFSWNAIKSSTFRSPGLPHRDSSCRRKIICESDAVVVRSVILYCFLRRTLIVSNVLLQSSLCCFQRSCYVTIAPILSLVTVAPVYCVTIIVTTSLPL